MLLLLLLAVVPACDDPKPPPAPEPQERFSGILTNIQGAPLAGTVSVNGTREETAADGAFDVRVPRADKYVFNAEAPHHLMISEVYSDSGSGQTDLRPQLRPTEVFRVDPTQPISQMDSRGTLLELPAGALVDGEGKPASEPLTLSMHTYDLREEQMVGDMSALNAAGELVALLSLGAVSVEFSDDAGKSYNLASGSKARISLKVDPIIDHQGPVPLWWYDTQQGLWREEGLGNVENGVATGEVAHFSFWNFDLPLTNPACIRIDVDATWFSSQGYSSAKPLKLTARASGYPKTTVMYIYTPAPQVLYNITPRTQVDLSIEGVAVASVNSGEPHGPWRTDDERRNACKGVVKLGEPPKVGTLRGKVLRQHRPDRRHGGVTITARVGSTSVGTIKTSPTGEFVLTVPAGTVGLTASLAGYLPAVRDNVVVAAGSTITLPDVELLAGNLDPATDCITPADTALLINAIDRAPVGDDPYDIDGDGKIDYPDLVLATSNAGVLATSNSEVCSPTAW
ncbi:carboxypeptidase-like regulatory domain-containing protein [Archangium violaceum]|uniref:EF-hand domain-containing protein n=1 Tax=Archangium violaceum Cb vi76 TaxID=1406225 RepID=A0A084SSC9_9BACT|nr:carboxypeptidase-like regulatory domain-containing protein [Archangium violaceum]KFA91364.1 hypothetical protein Q664_22550 [Archangium violaceum Cb vi76]